MNKKHKTQSTKYTIHINYALSKERQHYTIVTNPKKIPVSRR